MTVLCSGCPTVRTLRDCPLEKYGVWYMEAKRTVYRRGVDFKRCDQQC